MTASVQARIRRSVRYSRFDMEQDNRVRQGSLQRERISWNEKTGRDAFRNTQDWVNGVGVSPSGRFQVIEEARPKQKWFGAEGIRWDAARFLLILGASLMFAVLLAVLASIGASDLQIQKLQDKISAVEQKNEKLQAELAASTGDISVCTEAIKLNMISSNGARTLTLTAPQGAGMLLVEAARDPGEPGTEIRGQAEND